MTTPEAFNQLIQEKGIHHQLEITASQLAALRYDYRNRKVSAEKMEELLLKAGYRKVPEYWHKP
jgi:hypothetical protein